jgi:hypothetical protein
MEKGNPSQVWVNTRPGLIQSVISADTKGKICTFPMIEGMSRNGLNYTIYSNV